MSNRMKLVVAGLIVAALAALIIVDDQTSKPPATSTETQPPANPDPYDFLRVQPPLAAESQTAPATPVEEVILNLQDSTQAGVVDAAGNLTPSAVQSGAPTVVPDSAGSTGVRKAFEQSQPVEATPPPNDTYTIVQGDSFYTIAQKVYGDGNLFSLIQKANPDVDSRTLRIGKTLQIPPKAATEVLQAETFATATAQPGVYVVQSGDTLSGISQKVFGTVKYQNRIFEFNRDKLSSPDELVVGMKLALPEAAATVSTPVSQNPTEIPAGARIHTVASNDSLWKIASLYYSGQDIPSKIAEIVSANSDKLTSEDAMLKLGWRLVIP